jgi:hypothetical protein
VRLDVWEGQRRRFHNWLDGGRSRQCSLCSGGTLPVLLADIKYADLANDRDRGVADLLKAIR